MLLVAANSACFVTQPRHQPNVMAQAEYGWATHDVEDSPSALDDDVIKCLIQRWRLRVA